jgi:long-chain acyl-CoA synthetase
MASDNFASRVVDVGRQAASATAIRHDDAVVSYHELGERSVVVTQLLRSRGIGAGDRVAMQLPNCVHFPAIYFGILRCGAIVVPMNPLLKAREIEYQLADSGAVVLFAWRDMADEARQAAQATGVPLIVVEPERIQALSRIEPRDVPVVRRDADDVAVIIYTSGTTGVPKGAALSHGNLLAAAQASVELLAATSESTLVGALPLFHVFGMNSIMNTALLAGGTVTIVQGFTAERTLEVVQRDHATHFAGVPTMYSAMLHCPDAARFDVSSLKLCVSGGAALPIEVLRGYEKVFGCQILEGYGLSETTGMASFNRRGARKPGSIGRPVGDSRLRILDDDGTEVLTGEAGELVMQGSFVMVGYWEGAEATEDAMRGGWFHTGDIARCDEDGYYFIVDRKKDLIIRGGYNVYPREVEEVLYEHPAVREAAVVGIADEHLGEEVGAAVALKTGHETTAEELRSFLKERIAAYKYPRVIWFVDELPKGPTGKILKREIAASRQPQSAR